jgi:hypothetical protein
MLIILLLLQVKFPDLSFLLIFKNHLTLIRLNVKFNVPFIILFGKFFIVKYEKIKKIGSDIISFKSQRNLPFNWIKLLSIKKGL